MDVKNIKRPGTISHPSPLKETDRTIHGARMFSNEDSSSFDASGLRVLPFRHPSSFAGAASRAFREALGGDGGAAAGDLQRAGASGLTGADRRSPVLRSG